MHLQDSMPSLDTTNTGAFLQKGKPRLQSIIAKSPKYTAALAQLGLNEDIYHSDADIIEQYVCEIYGKSKSKRVNEARYIMFQDMYTSRKRDMTPWTESRVQMPV